MKRSLFLLGKRLKTLEYWLTARLVIGVLALLRRLPPEKALDLAEKVARTVGPKVGRHRLAVDNLRQAYPEKSEAEIETLALDMWGNMARLAVEYVFLDKLFDFDPEAETPGRVEVEGVEIFKRLRDEKDVPHIFFTGHLGNFEFLPIAASRFELATTSLFRPPNNPYVADYILKTRSSAMGGLVPSQAGAALQLARVLDDGGNIGVLVDQKFRKGVKTRFFGRECRTNPLLPKLARQYDCDVYPARCKRLPGGRYRLIVEDRITLPRQGDGTIDIDASAQLLNDVVERWVREDPGQWMWFHKRWQI
ncbi:lipid A biosynthesis lauroyl acyltransferase [Nitratireductor sp. L1-7-SE]|uniref:Lipid A biosynthesis lauroyl acyltransferase n=1 Tax=Nitratireductor rhodophyticola TaxID=2854036 RepID=A0ABS7R2E4_9HYPH|nr:lipid A biosynthesis lauroyl acyltransferase [Nitratireductor rhodophyticola]MBY8915117.1 lipid A biosynthesis lauroyl acyltransferase [Nitratireductor rhodophyticola]MBY8919813.1 lipid A biosynthesis lauroyl acyltransferase [Nitratireductor rhodophyticola]